MRSLTLVTFVLFAFFAAGRIVSETAKDAQWRWSPFERATAIAGEQSSAPVTVADAAVRAAVDIAIVGLLLLLVRIVIRSVFLYWRIDPEVRISRGELNSAHERLVNACQKIAGKISDIEDDEIWPDWAAKTAKVALWFAMRADYLDRYSTTCLWKLRRSFAVWEWGFRVTKVAAAVAIFGFVAWTVGFDQVLRSENLPHLGPLAAFVVMGILGWDRLHRAPNEFITILFQKGQHASARTHYFDAFASEYSQMVNMVIKATRG